MFEGGGVFSEMGNVTQNFLAKRGCFFAADAKKRNRTIAQFGFRTSATIVEHH